ncbi:MAG: alpha/beta hydrolase [Imperialibacter sp.]|uniref:alpha/beta fold hydrolase n=1 Tax=Imperialibacter sp. TaxID=2038411 RepID=UPI0032EAB2E8
MQKLFFLFAIPFFFLSCTDDATEATDTFYVRNEGADMPVWVRGNLDSGKIILYVHGGPGDCAMCYRYYLKGMESEVAVVYWDQRIAGSASGNVDPKTLNYEQYTEDAFYVVSLLRQQYPGKKIYLMGHSFGVEVTWQFLTTNDNQSMVAGALIVNGTFSNYRWMDVMRDWVIREATEQSNAKALSFAEENPVTKENIQELDWVGYYRHMLDLGGNELSLFSNKKFLINYALFTPNTTLAQFSHGKGYENYFDFEMLNYDTSDKLDMIDIPVAFLWGKKDGVVPIEIGYETEALLVNTTVDWTIFDDSWHEPFVSENEKFLEAALKFIREN